MGENIGNWNGIHKNRKCVFVKKNLALSGLVFGSKCFYYHTCEISICAALKYSFLLKYLYLHTMSCPFSKRDTLLKCEYLCYSTMHLSWIVFVIGFCWFFFSWKYKNIVVKCMFIQNSVFYRIIFVWRENRTCMFLR